MYSTHTGRVGETGDGSMLHFIELVDADFDVVDGRHFVVPDAERCGPRRRSVAG